MIICYGQILDSNVNSCFFLSFIFVTLDISLEKPTLYQRVAVFQLMEGLYIPLVFMYTIPKMWAIYFPILFQGERKIYLALKIFVNFLLLYPFSFMAVFLIFFVGLLDELPNLFFCGCLLNLLRVYLLDELASVRIDVFASTLTALRERVGECECRRVCLDEPSPPSLSVSGFVLDRN